MNFETLVPNCVSLFYNYVTFPADKSLIFAPKVMTNK